MAKKRSEAARSVEEKPSSGSAVNDSHRQLRQRQHKTPAGTAPLTNQILDSLEVYLENIPAAATQTVAK